MTAKVDVVEGDATGTIIPIEYKRSAAPDVLEGANLPERAQVCAQVLPSPSSSSNRLLPETVEHAP